MCNCERDDLVLKIVKLDHCLGLPEYKTVGASGMDLYASIEEDIVLGSLERTLIPSGIKIELPHGYEAQLRARSGKSIKDGITLINGIGTIDEDFRYEIQIPVVNLSRSNQIIKKGERIAQLVIIPYVQPKLEVTTEENLTQTERGTGFGSSGSF